MPKSSIVLRRVERNKDFLMEDERSRDISMEPCGSSAWISDKGFMCLLKAITLEKIRIFLSLLTSEFTVVLIIIDWTL